MPRTHEELMKIALAQPEVKQEYELLQEEFLLLETMVKARHRAGKTQQEVATAMQTTTSAVGRLETGGGKAKHSPSLTTLQKYAQAINCYLQLKFIPEGKA